MFYLGILIKFGVNNGIFFYLFISCPLTPKYVVVLSKNAIAPLYTDWS